MLRLVKIIAIFINYDQIMLDKMIQKFISLAIIAIV